MARQGMGPRDLAELLDHTDTQNVMVYYKSDSRFAERLDKATALQFGPLVKAFMGTIVPKTQQKTVDLIDLHHIPGLGECDANFICGLPTGKQCYVCTKFKPHEDGPHEDALQFTIGEREELLAAGNDRVAEQLDEVIFAIGEVLARIWAAREE